MDHHRKERLAVLAGRLGYGIATVPPDQREAVDWVHSVFDAHVSIAFYAVDLDAIEAFLREARRQDWAPPLPWYQRWLS
jgi:hypothetical protein